MFYTDRTEGAWAVFVWILILGHFVLPFLYGPPCGHHLRHHVPVRRVIVHERERSVHPTQRR